MLKLTKKVKLNQGKGTKQMKPYEIKEKLDEYIIGQEMVKKMMAVEFYQKSLPNADSFMKTNLLLCGPTGSGKTFIVEVVSKIMGLPYHVIDATSLTQEGFKGLSVNEVINSIFQRFEKEEAERAIVFIDEIDKLAIKDDESNGIATLGVQQELLKIIEGTNIQLLSKDGESKLLNTKKMTFIFGGAFVGIEDIIENRLMNEPESPKTVQPQDLIEFGLIPEFVGRIPSIATLNRLEPTELLDVIFKSNKSIYKEYQSLYNLYNIELELEASAAYLLAMEAFNLNTGVRGLNQKLGQLLRDIQYDVLLKEQLPLKVIITSETVINKRPVLIGSQSWESIEKITEDTSEQEYFMSNDEHFYQLQKVNLTEHDHYGINAIAKEISQQSTITQNEFLNILAHHTEFDDDDLKIINHILKNLISTSNLKNHEFIFLFTTPNLLLNQSVKLLDQIALNELKRNTRLTKILFTKEYKHLYEFLTYLILIAQETMDLSSKKLA